jgi:hypothetical protein
MITCTSPALGAEVKFQFNPRDSLLLWTGFKAGYLYGCFAENYPENRRLLFRVTPWPTIGVEARMLKPSGSSWLPLSDEDSSWVLQYLSINWIFGIHESCAQWTDSAHRTQSFGYGGSRDAATKQTLRREHYFRFVGMAPYFMQARLNLNCGGLILLRLYSRCPETADLYAHDRVLLSLLSRHWEVRCSERADWAELNRRMRGPRIGLLEFLDFPARPMVREYLRSYTGENYRIAHFGALRRWLGSPPLLEAFAQKMAVLPITQRTIEDRKTPVVIVPSPLLEILSRAPELLDQLQSYSCSAANWREDSFQQAVYAALELAYYCKQPKIAGAVSRYKKTWRLDPQKIAAVELPQLPWPGDEDLQPLRTLGDLLEESAAMKNCVGSVDYLAGAARGEIFVYRFTGVVRATVAIRVGEKEKYFEGPLGLGNESFDRLIKLYVRNRLQCAFAQITPRRRSDLICRWTEMTAW